MASLFRSTGVVALSTATSRIFGFIREVLFANYFGATGSTDAFFVAFRIPNLLRRLVAEGALTISFIPVYTEYRIKKGDREALALAQKTLTILTVVVVALVCLGIVFSPQIVGLFTMGIHDSSVISLAVFLNRVMFPFLFSAAFVAFSMGVLNSHGYFFAPAFATVMVNLGIICGIVVFSRFFDEPLLGVALGVLCGGLMQMFLQIPYLIKSGFKLSISFDLHHEGIRKIFRMIAPALFGIAVYQINILMSTILASMLPSGSISYLYYSDRLTEIVLGIFIIAIGNVILPEMSRMTATDDMARLKKLYVTSMRSSLFMAVPATVALISIGFPIISVLFMRGEFTVTDAAMTYRALLYASLGISSVAILRITTPAFYSMQDTKRPVIAASVSFVLNISLGYALMQTSLKHAGLALANSISSTAQMALLLLWLQKKIGFIESRQIILPVVKYLAASALMSLALIAVSSRIDWVHDGLCARAGIRALLVAGGAVTYGAVCYFLRVDELHYIVDRLKKKL